MIRDSESALTIADSAERTKLAPAVDASLHGSVLVLIQFDVCEEIRLDKLREIFGARTLEQPTLKHPAPGYVRYQRPPVVEPIESLVLESGERLEGQIKFYDYGVVSVVLELPFSGDWDTLVRLGSRWVWDVDFAGHASRIAHQKLERATPALVNRIRIGSAKTTSFFTFARSVVVLQPMNWCPLTDRVSLRLFVEKRHSFPRVNRTKSCSREFRTIRTI